jgi:type IV pilus assembly protein PilF
VKRIAPLLAVQLLLSACASSAEREAERERVEKLVLTYAQLGGAYLQRGQLDVAREELAKALALDPTSGPANNVMAVLQWKLKNYPVAEEHFRTALDADAKSSSAHHNYGAFLCDRGRVDEGARELEKAANDPLYPLGAEVNVNAGICMLKKGATKLAEQYFREALRGNPQHARALYEMARISLETGEPLRARGFLLRYFQVGSETAESLYLGVRIERSLKNRETEANYAVHLHEKFPDSPEAVQLAKEYKGNRAKN